VLAVREKTDPNKIAGLASRREVLVAAGEKALLRQAATQRPDLTTPAPADLGFVLGSSRGVTCWASVEDSMVLLGAARSGKGLHVVIPMILDAPGAVITTSTRPDKLAVTLHARAKLGPVAAFDPHRRARPPPTRRSGWKCFSAQACGLPACTTLGTLPPLCSW
jgi:type IV secretion system protein VirD4